MTATHWYRLGAPAALRVPASALRTWDEHPQSGYLVAGAGRTGWRAWGCCGGRGAGRVPVPRPALHTAHG